MKLKFKTPLNQQNYGVLTRKPCNTDPGNEVKSKSSPLQPNADELPTIDNNLPLMSNSLPAIDNSLPLEKNSLPLMNSCLPPIDSSLLSIDNRLSPLNNVLSPRVNNSQPMDSRLPMNDIVPPTDVNLPIMTTFLVDLPLNVNKIDVGSRTHVILPRFTTQPTTEERKSLCKMNKTVRKEIAQKLSDRCDRDENETVEPPDVSNTADSASLNVFNPHKCPDITDPYNYCCFHGMNLPPLTSYTKVQPDPDDPNFHCKSCQRNYRGRKNYRDHLQRIHFLRLRDCRMPEVYRDIEIDVNDPKNIFCIYCKTKYSDVDHYRRHMKKIHKNGRTEPVKGKAKVNPLIVPDVYDPNFYCKSCKITLRRRAAYRYHLFIMHNIQTLQ
ncbi:hypothetical protein INT47_013224 [Mucor saturninus]|uniref:C2H2-type domain-containing protein n=1 Tax=Mucor saturninus TaxID=64648 RepID=A0A8H7R488_9FUNG|nr:hypothetical protein INT47_013224 [Mucor saturninus]